LPDRQAGRQASDKYHYIHAIHQYS